MKPANRRKKEIHSIPVEQRRQRELHWIIEDIAAIQQTDNIAEEIEITTEKISTKNEGRSTQGSERSTRMGKKVRNPVRANWRNMAILHLSRRIEGRQTK